MRGDEFVIGALICRGQSRASNEQTRFREGWAERSETERTAVTCAIKVREARAEREDYEKHEAS